MSTNSYAEKSDAETPALRFLQRLGYQLLTPEQAMEARENRPHAVLLENILAKKLREINGFDYLDTRYEFSEASIQLAVQALRDIPDEGLVRTNEQVYELLTLGKSAPETVQGDTKSYTLRYIDWAEPRNNDYHVVPQLLVQGAQHKRWPDLTLFVNGIPFGIIEAKRRDGNHTVEEGIRQHVRNYDYEEGIPRLYHYAQLLLALQPNEVRYGTTGAKLDFWSGWREQGQSEASLEAAVQRVRLRKLPGLPPEPTDTLPTEQDRQLYCLCRPERLLELINRFTLFDGGVRKVARYQQYFAVRNTLERVRTRNTASGPEGEAPASRRGGIIWHTQGSGKSLTMVLLAKALALQPDILRPRVVLVTDRRDLDRQIRKTFQQCGKEVAPARSGQHLIELLQDRRADVITAIIDKFDTALRGREFQDPDANIFVLIDESHRSQFGNRHQKMRRLLPSACYIGFTGTPLLKADRSTARRFGGFIDKYTIRQAVHDGAVLPLLYEGRHLSFDINALPLDRGVDRVTESLPEYQAQTIKQRHARRVTHLYGSPQVVEEIAHDIAKHYTGTWQGTGLKAQLAVTSKRVAVLYHQAFQRLAKTNPALRINSAVIISPPDRLLAADEDVNVYEEADQTGLVKRFWDETVTPYYTSPEAYEEDIIDRFNSSSDEVELLIVVSKLLTGFDAPRNTVLYLARHLESHTLLQAIARVNRLFTGKQFGYIIDYAHLLGHLDKALTDYDELQGFDEEDLLGTVTNVDEEVEKLPDHHSAVWALFPRELNRPALDLEALERHLAPADRRDEFRACLSRFARTLQIALSVAVPPAHLNLDYYRQQLALFTTLWRSVKARYADDQDFREYEASIRKLLYTHVGVVDIEPMGEPISIFEQVGEQQPEPAGPAKSRASKADFIAHNLKKVISERLDQDRVLYEKFSRLLQTAINDFHQQRTSEVEYLRQVQELTSLVGQGYDAGIPAALRHQPEARALFNTLKKALSEVSAVAQPAPEQLASVALEVEQLLRTLLIRDWRRNPDVQNQMHNAVEDYFLDHQVELGLAHLIEKDKYDLLDNLWDRTLEVARNNFA
ncbi:type I restriction endonuclease subunit R [Hymenobacter defluvii]|uniref:Type I restriction enzyme endonuclease subunit n=1 Tax=Hymenobacter defluvii TaxID=2054411 RepID=A0ABS3TED4_9BACT|nr:type I restriction endonuclease subunit R [Hymenobacter defluvii]MBO3272015.1 type I restriction endonuclease subunit R [Hymenobacter defluvii]